MYLNKAALRETLLIARSRVTATEREAAAFAAHTFFIESDLFSSNKHFALYLANKNEFDTTPLIEALWQAGKKCYLPILLDKREAGLQFSLYTPETKLSLNRYKILEPEHPEIFPAEKLDIVFLPLVGFDLQGNRLGMGAGYYDRTFGFLSEKKNKKPFLMGLGYEFQCVKELPCESWDVRLEGVLTEKQIIFISS